MTTSLIHNPVGSVSGVELPQPKGGAREIALLGPLSNELRDKMSRHLHELYFNLGSSV